MNCFRQAKSLKADKKIDKMLDGLSYLSNSVLEVSDSVTPISMMNATSAVLADNIQKMINQSQLNIINTLGNKKRAKAMSKRMNLPSTLDVMASVLMSLV